MLEPGANRDIFTVDRRSGKRISFMVMTGTLYIRAHGCCIAQVQLGQGFVAELSAAMKEFELPLEEETERARRNI